MYGIDWEEPAPKRKYTKHKIKRGKIVQADVPRKKIRAAGDKGISAPLGGKVPRDVHYKILHSKAVDAPSPEGQDYHVNAGEGRVMPKFNWMDKSWNAYD